MVFSLSDWWNVSCGLPQGLILGPLLFQIFYKRYAFLCLKFNLCNFTGDNTICSSGQILGDVLYNIKLDLEYFLKWFKVNSLK